MNEDPATPRGQRAAPGRRVIAGASILAGALSVVAGVVVFASSQGESLILLGRVSPLVMGPLIVVLGCIALAWGVTAINGPGVRIKVLAVSAVTATFVILIIYGFSGTVGYVEVAKDGAGRAYVVEEKGIALSSAARLLEVNGVIAKPVGRLASNNGVRAFAAGDYRAQLTPSGLVLSYQVGSSTDLATETFPLSRR